MPDHRPPYSSAQDDVQRVLQVNQCEGSTQVILRDTVPRATPPGGSDESIGISGDSFPWDVVMVGGLALGLAALVAVAVRRQRRQH